MKNLVIALSLFFALGTSAQAQKTKTTTSTTYSQSDIDSAAQKDLNNLMTVVNDLSPDKQQAFKQLFVTKHEMLAEGLSNERKRAITESMEYRFSLLLDPAALAKLKADQKLYDSLIH